MEQDLEAVELNSIEHASLQSILQILKEIREMKKGIDLNFKKLTKRFLIYWLNQCKNKHQTFSYE